MDAQPDLARRFGVSAKPTFKFLVGGEVVDELRGANPAKLTEKVDQHLAAAGPQTFGSGGQSLGGGSGALSPAERRAAAADAAAARFANARADKIAGQKAETAEALEKKAQVLQGVVCMLCSFFSPAASHTIASVHSWRWALPRSWQIAPSRRRAP